MLPPAKVVKGKKVRWRSERLMKVKNFLKEKKSFLKEKKSFLKENWKEILLMLFAISILGGAIFGFAKCLDNIEESSAARRAEWEQEEKKAYLLSEQMAKRFFTNYGYKTYECQDYGPYLTCISFEPKEPLVLNCNRYYCEKK